TTVEDLLRWDRELAAPTLLRPGTLEEAVRPATLESGEEIAYGLGFRLGRYRGHDRVSHDAHDVGGHAAFVRHPGLGLTVVVLSNRDDCEAMRLADLVVDVCLETPTRGGH